MKVAIMQPYFLPYIGYFQLINSVDDFIVYDNIEFTKKGWFNRNRMILNKRENTFSIPIKSGSDFLHVKDRFIAQNFIKQRRKTLAQIKESYAKSPYFEEVFILFENIFNYENTNLFEFIYNSIIEVCKFLEIETKITISSSINIDHTLKGQDKVINICKAFNATNYINSIGGVELYDKDTFKEQGIDLKFIKSSQIVYKQFNNDFIPWLSILDVMMFNSKIEIKNMLNQYSLV